MPLRRLAVLLTCIVCSGLTGQATVQDDYIIEYLDVTDGLASNYVSSIVTDDRGIKWMATEGGLNSFDGHRFELYIPRTVGPGLPSENVEMLLPSSDGQVWIATKGGGIVKYDPGLDRFANFTAALDSLIPPGFRVLALAEDGNERLWIASENNGVIVVDPTAASVVMHRSPGRRVAAIMADHAGNVWYGMDSILFQYRVKEDAFATYPGIPRLIGLAEDVGASRLWLASGRQLAAFNLQSNALEHRETVEDIPAGFYIKCLRTGPAGTLWLGTWGGGLFLRRPNGRYEEMRLSRLYEGTADANHRSIIDIHCDDNGLVWLATGFGGVVKLNPRKGFRFLGNQPQRESVLRDNNVRAIEVDATNTVWLGTHGGGVHRWTPGGVPAAAGTTPLTKINDILIEGGEQLVAGREGAWRSQSSGGSPRLDVEISHVATLHRDARGGLWIGAQEDGLAYRPGEGDTVPPIRFSDSRSQLANPRVNAFAEYGPYLWIGTYGGVHRLDLRTRKIDRPEAIGGVPSGSPICHDLLARAGELWVATPSGLSLYRVGPHGDLELGDVYTTEDGLPDDFVTAITMSADGIVWGSTSRGLFRLDPQNGHVVTFGPKDGLTAGAFNIAAVAQGPDRVLYFGGTNGLIYFHPDSIVTYRPPPPLVLTTLEVNGELVEVGDTLLGKVVLPAALDRVESIKLSYTLSSFSLGYAVTDYLGSETLTSQYRLRGLSDRWVEVSEFGRLNFNGLRPGKYVLELRGSRDRFTWSEPVVLGIHIPPPPWRSLPAYLLYFLVLCGIVYAIRRTALVKQRLESRTELAELKEQQKHELTESKLAFFTNISHELRTPLTLILTPLTDLLRAGALLPETRRVLSGVHRNSARLLDLVNQLLDFRKAESGQLRLRAAQGDFTAFVREIHRSFQPLADSKAITYRMVLDDDLREDIYYDRDKLEIVLCNLLSNAFKFCKQEVRLTLSFDAERVVVSVADDGPGIPPEERERVFERFTQLHHHHESSPISSGIGLAFSRYITELHHGSVTVAEGPLSGANFVVSLPKGRDHLSPEDLLTNFRGHDDRRHYTESIAPADQAETADTPTSLLLVDDNPEILEYLRRHLSVRYAVITARNGVEALELARENIPEVVVSDVMMPEMDGIELCKRLKQDVATSHIPVLLLTARTSTVYQLTGLREGADDYVTKPFSTEVLLARVSNLLQNRERLRSHYLNQLRFEPRQLPPTDDPEEAFLRKLTEIVTENVEEAELTGDFLAAKLFVSRSTLFRKIKSLTGLSINAFIRSVRLQRAAERLVAEPHLSISQIAYESGFKDAKYFRKTFQKQFDALPSEYRIPEADAGEPIP